MYSPADANLEPSTPNNKDDSHDSETESTGLESDPLHSSPQLPFGSQPATAILPKIQTPTGEEGEKKIVQVRWEGWRVCEYGRWRDVGGCQREMEAERLTVVCMIPSCTSKPVFCFA